MRDVNFLLQDVTNCIDQLVIFGFIEQKLKYDEFHYEITEKGKFILHKFYNNIDYLYYSCLDTKLPENVFSYIKDFVSPNNVPVDNEDRFFPSNCVIIGIVFLNFLYFCNNEILNNVDIKAKLSSKNVPIEMFKLPIKRDANNEYKSLYDTINTILDTGYAGNKTKYVERVISWLQNIR